MNAAYQSQRMKKFLYVSLLLALQTGLSAQCLSVLNCPAAPVTYCDVSPNDPQLWKDSLFYDPIISSHDVGEIEANLSVQIMDACPAGDIQASFVLRLDLNNDGVQETAITGTTLPGSDTVYFGNAANPNFSGGIPRPFDLRPVPADQKYRFILEKTLAGNVTTIRLRWVTAAVPGTYLVPQLPYGKHRIDWYFAKNGETKTCGYVLAVKDCKAPTVVCQTGLSVNIMPTQMIQLWATDFLQYAEDNHTPAAQLKYGVRRSGTGTGFPYDNNGDPITNVFFTCDDVFLGPRPIELWVIDAAGNADYCETYVIITDNNSNCDPGGVSLTVCAVNHCDGSPISEVSYGIGSSSNPVPPFTIFNPADTSGCLQLDNSIPIGSNYTITPLKDNNPLNGVSTYDLVLISRHILGLEPLGNPYKMIAADANKSGSITTFDIVELRKLILGFYQELPNNTSWRFVDSSFTFPNANNPFQTVFPENISAANVQAGLTLQFFGIKIGDVNCNALNVMGETPEEEALSIPNLHLQANDVAEVPVQFLQAGNYYGFQFGLHFDPTKIQVLEVLPGLGNQDNFGVFADRVNVSWSYGEALTQLPDVPMYRLRIKALAELHLADVFSLTNQDLHAEAYPTTDSLVGLRLEFGTVAISEPALDREIYAPQPNPTSAGVQIPLRLEQAETVTVEIVDATGRLVYYLEQAAGAGAQLLEVPASALPQTGLYGWRVQAGTASRTGKLVKQ